MTNRSPSVQQSAVPITSSFLFSHLRFPLKSNCSCVLIGQFITWKPAVQASQSISRRNLEETWAIEVIKSLKVFLPCARETCRCVAKGKRKKRVGGGGQAIVDLNLTLRPFAAGTGAKSFSTPSTSDRQKETSNETNETDRRRERRRHFSTTWRSRPIPAGPSSLTRCHGAALSPSLITNPILGFVVLSYFQLESGFV